MNTMSETACRKILVIDDDAQFHKLMSFHLSREGFDQVQSASNGLDGVEKARTAGAAIIIIDTLLPDMDGFEICRRIRDTPGSEQAKIIITTGSIDAVDAGKAREAGADDYIVKTSDFSHLVNAVKRFYSN